MYFCLSFAFQELEENDQYDDIQVGSQRLGVAIRLSMHESL